MNELVFIVHITAVCAAVLLALRHSYAALVSVLGLQLVVANLFVLKQVQLFGLTATGSEIFTVSTMYGVGIIQQVYGDKKAQEAIYYGFALLLFFAATATIHGWYTPLAISTTNKSFVALFSHTPRLVFASSCAYLFSEFVNLRLARAIAGRATIHPLLRVLTVWLGQWVDTITFAYIGLYGVFINLGQVIVFCMVVKTIAVVAIAPLVVLARTYVQPGGE